MILVGPDAVVYLSLMLSKDDLRRYSQVDTLVRATRDFQLCALWGDPLALTRRRAALQPPHSSRSVISHRSAHWPRELCVCGGGGCGPIDRMPDAPSSRALTQTPPRTPSSAMTKVGAGRCSAICSVKLVLVLEPA